MSSLRHKYPRRHPQKRRAGISWPLRVGIGRTPSRGPRPDDFQRPNLCATTQLLRAAKQSTCPASVTTRCGFTSWPMYSYSATYLCPYFSSFSRHWRVDRNQRNAWRWQVSPRRPHRSISTSRFYGRSTIYRSAGIRAKAEGNVCRAANALACNGRATRELFLTILTNSQTCTVLARLIENFSSCSTMHMTSPRFDGLSLEARPPQQ